MVFNPDVEELQPSSLLFFLLPSSFTLPFFLSWAPARATRAVGCAAAAVDGEYAWQEGEGGMAGDNVKQGEGRPVAHAV